MEHGTSIREAESWLPRDTVRSLAQSVVQELGMRAQPQPAVRASVLDKLINQILTRGLFDAARVASLLRDQRLTDLETVHTYIPSAARQLGQMWMANQTTFAEVTIATARLQALTHEISGRWTTEVARDAPMELNAMIAALEGEDHTLGAVTLSSLVRRKGHNIDLRLGAKPQTILADLATSPKDVLILTCARTERVATLATLINDIRQTIERCPLIAVGGQVMEQCFDVKQQTGADIATRDIYKVLKLAQSFRRGRIALVK